MSLCLLGLKRQPYFKLQFFRFYFGIFLAACEVLLDLWAPVLHVQYTVLHVQPALRVNPNSYSKSPHASGLFHCSLWEYIYFVGNRWLEFRIFLLFLHCINTFNIKGTVRVWVFFFVGISWFDHQDSRLENDRGERCYCTAPNCIQIRYIWDGFPSVNLWHFPSNEWCSDISIDGRSLWSMAEIQLCKKRTRERW